MKHRYLVLFVLILMVSFLTNSLGITSYAIDVQNITNGNSSITVSDEISAHIISNELSLLINETKTAIMKSPSDFGYSSSEINLIEVKGPYKIFTEVSANNWIVKRVNYHFIINNEIRGVLTLYLINGSVNAEYSINYADIVNELSNNDEYVLLENDDGIYYLSNSSVVPVYKQNTQSGTQTSTLALADYDFETASLNYNAFKTFQPDVEVIQVQSSYNSIMIRNTVTRSVSVPLVSQYEYEYYEGHEIQTQKYCHNACIAAVAATRDPGSYSGLTAADVYDTTGLDYLISSNRAMYIHNALEDYYLSSGHSSDYDTSYPLTISDFKNACDNDWLYIAVATWNNGDNYHCTVIYDYTELSTGGIYVNMMDPFTETYRLITWRSGTFSYSQSSQYTAVLDEYVVSYY